ncbi:hypothetical protein BLA29_014726, partial [Euroglyphus maynei]
MFDGLRSRCMIPRLCIYWIALQIWMKIFDHLIRLAKVCNEHNSIWIHRTLPSRKEQVDNCEESSIDCSGDS